MTKIGDFNKRFQRGVTYEGGQAFFPSSKKEELVKEVLTSFWREPKFYGNTDYETFAMLSKIRSLCSTAPKFIMHLAIYARQELHLRSISHVLVGELAAAPRGKRYVKESLKNIVIRPDDMTEILTYYLTVYGKPIPNCLKKGIAAVFPKFDEYSLAKYKKTSKIVSLKDALCLTHPIPQSIEMSQMWKRLLEDNLTIPYTWETELSVRGNTKEVWEDLIESGKVGYMALLRNLRNIYKASPENLREVLRTLSSEEAVIASKQLPFRFYSAYKAIKAMDSKDHKELVQQIAILISLERAMEYSIKSLPKMEGKTLIAVDSSSSMCWASVSKKGTIKAIDVAATLASILYKLCKAPLLSLFDNQFRFYPLDPSRGVLKNTEEIRQTAQGGATNTFLIFSELLQKKIFVDRIVIISDDQGAFWKKPGQFYLEEYQRFINPNVWIHIIDTAGYPTQQFKGERVNYISGWSEKVLQFIPLVEKGVNNLISFIEKGDFITSLK